MNLSQRKTPVGRVDLLLLLEHKSYFHRDSIIGKTTISVNHSDTVISI